MADDVEGQDEDYKRAVQSLEDQQHGRAGWLFARGALDKGDQAYLKEQEQLQRHAEEALQEREAAEFAAARALAEEEQRRRAVAAAAGKIATTTATGNKRNELKTGKKKRLLPTIMKVKSGEKEDEVAPEYKKSKVIGPASANDKTAVPPLPQKKEVNAEEEKEKEEKDEGQGDILAGLLGGYDSANSDDDSDNDNVNNQKKKGSPPSKQQQQQQQPTLPSAADLLS